MTHPRRNFERHALFGACLLALLAATPAALSAQRMRIGSSNPTGITGGAAFENAILAAGDTRVGVELWCHTSTATRRLLDVYPGPISSYPTEITRRSPNNGNTWFVARAIDQGSQELGRELHYLPDLPSSTAGGFVLDILPGAGSSEPAQLTLVGSTLFFTADDGLSGRELWTSDGTLAGTARIKDIVVGPLGSFPFGLTAFDNRLFFAAPSDKGVELWVSDGTTAGTVMLKDIRDGAASSTPSDFTEWNGQLYFAATTDAHGRELWCTDGTEQGTVLVEDITTGPESSAPSQLTAGAGLAFTAWTPLHRRQLYIRSTSGSLARVSGAERSGSIAEITPFDQTFCFRATTTGEGAELRQTTPTGTRLMHDLRTGAESSFPSNFRVHGNSLLFRADDGNSGFEYWCTDGQTAKLVQDIRTGDCDARPSRLTPLGSGTANRFLFAAKGNANGVELWETDGVSAKLIQDIDDETVLPGLHWASDQTTTTITVKDGRPQAPAVLLVGTEITQLQTFPFLTGAVSVNLQTPIKCFILQMDPNGEAELSFPSAPPVGPPTSIVSQAVVETAPQQIAISVPGSCNQGALQIAIPNGPRVEGRICLDDESGEYQLGATRTDNNNCDGFLGLYQVGPTGDLQLIQCCPIRAGDTIEETGRIEILLPLDALDGTGRHLELHLFEDPPTPTSPSPGSLVTTSYC